MAISLSPSPLAVARAVLNVLYRDPGRLAAGIGVFFLAPYVAGYFLIYKPALDGLYGDAIGYYLRYYGFILLFFVIKALNACVTGQIIFNRLKGQPRPLHAVVPHGLVNAVRTLAVYVPVAALIYLGNAAWTVPGLVAGYFAVFFLAAVLYDRLGLVSGWKAGARARNGHNLMLVVNFLLLAAFVFGMQKLTAPLSGFVTRYVSADAATVTTAVVYAVIELAGQLWGIALYVLPQGAAPTGDIASVFD